MKSVNGIGGADNLTGNIVDPSIVSEIKRQSFSEILQQKFDSVVGAKQFDEVRRFEHIIKDSGELKPRELIMYQVQASQFGLRVELLSRVGESLLNMAKKFQQAQ